jgi:lipoate-protein ligase A
LPDAFPPYSLDDALFERAERTTQPQRAVYTPPETMVVLGRGSKVAREVDLTRCQTDGVPVFRRRGGGCTVVLDPGNVIVSTVFFAPGMIDVGRTLRGCADWLQSGLSALGYRDIERAGISDLAIGGQKISGSCLYRSRSLVYFSATLLVDADLPALERYLVHPPREPDYRKGRSHGDFVGRLLHSDYPRAADLARALGDRLEPFSPKR